MVKGLIKGDATIFAELDTNKAWDNLDAVLSESVNDNTRTAGLNRTMLKSKQRDGVVVVGPEAEGGTRDSDTAPSDTKVDVFASGYAGLVYFTDSRERMTYEQIQAAHPDLILGLIDHPGIGLVLVKSEKDGALAVGKGGIYFLDDDEVEAVNPLAVFGANAPAHLRRESSFEDCPDLVINTAYDPVSDELAGFSNPASHHGGLGGLQNRPFILHPPALPVDGISLVGAESVYRLVRGWREQVRLAPSSRLRAKRM